MELFSKNYPWELISKPKPDPVDASGKIPMAFKGTRDLMLRGKSCLPLPWMQWGLKPGGSVVQAERKLGILPRGKHDL